MAGYNTYKTYQELLPEVCYRSQELKASGIVLHYFSGRYVDYDNRFDPTVCRNLILDLNRPQSERNFYLKDGRQKRYYASYHYFIDRDGNVYNWTPKFYQAYHAGKSQINGKKNLNGWTYGISFAGDTDSGFTHQQYESGARLCVRLETPFNNVWGHDEVSPNRKVDPGPNFSWEKLTRLRRSFKTGTI